MTKHRRIVACKSFVSDYRIASYTLYRYVGNLDDKVDREMLKNLFSTVGPVTTVKIVKRNVSPFMFVEL